MCFQCTNHVCIYEQVFQSTVYILKLFSPMFNICPHMQVPDSLRPPRSPFTPIKVSLPIAPNHCATSSRPSSCHEKEKAVLEFPLDRRAPMVRQTIAWSFIFLVFSL